MCGTLIGLAFTLFGLGNLWVLQKIGWSSDGPGALLFYIGAAVGLLGGIPLLFGGGKGSSAPPSAPDENCPW